MLPRYCQQVAEMPTRDGPRPGPRATAVKRRKASGTALSAAYELMEAGEKRGSTGPHTAERAGNPAAEAGRSGALERHLSAGHRAPLPARTGDLARTRDPLDGVPIGATSRNGWHEVEE